MGLSASSSTAAIIESRGDPGRSDASPRWRPAWARRHRGLVHYRRNGLASPTPDRVLEKDGLRVGAFQIRDRNPWFGSEDPPLQRQCRMRRKGHEQRSAPERARSVSSAWRDNTDMRSHMGQDRNVRQQRLFSLPLRCSLVFWGVTLRSSARKCEGWGVGRVRVGRRWLHSRSSG